MTWTKRLAPILLCSILLCSIILSLPSCSTPAPTPTTNPGVITATGLSPQENVQKYGIPAIVVPFDYPVPDGMIQDPAEQEAMIEAKVAHLQQVNRLFMGQAPGTPQDRQAVFDELWATVEQYFVAFDGLETDWDAFYETHRQKIGQVQSYGEYLAILTRLAYLLGESHTYIFTAKFWNAFLETGLGDDVIRGPVPGFFPMGSDSSIGACIEVTPEEELVVSRIRDGSPNPYRFQVGDEIVGFNGIPWPQWIPGLEAADILIFGSGAGAETARRYHLLQSAMQNAYLFESINIRRVDRGDVETLPFVFIDEETTDAGSPACPVWTETEGLVSVEDSGKALSWQDDPVFVYGVIEDRNVGYMYIKHLDPQDPAQFADYFERAVLSLMDTDGLIIDLRGNGGGEYPGPLFPGLSHLVRGSEDRQYYAYAVNDPNSADRADLVPLEQGWGEACQQAAGDARFDLAGLCQKAIEAAHGRDAVPFPADDPDLYYTHPIVVLVGPWCASACDQLVHLLSQFPEFTIIGRDPNGSMTSPLNWDRVYTYPQMGEAVLLKVPAVAPYALGGAAVEHLCRTTGVVDVEVWFTREDIIRGADNVREYALQIIQESGAAE